MIGEMSAGHGAGPPLALAAETLAAALVGEAAGWSKPAGRALAQPLVHAALDLDTAVGRALYAPAERIDCLERADEALARARVVLRIARALSVLSDARLADHGERAAAVGRMIGGWRRSLIRRSAGSRSGARRTGGEPPVRGA